MKTAVVTQPGVLAILEVPVPEISDDEVLVEVKYCGICGSDVHTFLPGSMPPPIYIGHEFSGVLAEVGKNVEGWQVGDRVAVNPGYACGTCFACRHGQPGACEIGSINTLGCVTGQEHAGAFANYVRVSLPRYRLNRLPDEVSFEAGALAEPLSVALHGVLLSQVQMGETVMVMGAGGVGLGAAAFLRHLGAGTVIVTETIAARAALAKKLGADYVFNPATDNNIDNEVLDLTHGRGVDLIIEASGSPAAFESATYYLGRGGRITQISVVVPAGATRFSSAASCAGVMRAGLITAWPVSYRDQSLLSTRPSASSRARSGVPG